MIKQTLKEFEQSNKTIFLDDFIKIAHQDKKSGYYTTKKPIGKDGDFITAPEVSQIFGEIIAIKIIEKINQLNITQFNLIELGPGRGSLMIDIVRVLDNFLDKNIVNYSLYFHEINKFYINKLKTIFPDSQIKDEFSDYRNQYTIFIANEFFDALPIRQITKRNDTFFETAVKINEKNNLELSYVEPRKESLEYINSEISLANNEVYEFSPETNMIFEKIIKILLQNKGYFLLIDYGYYSSPKISTLQSIKDNKKTNILDNPGNQDITYHVDFDNFKNILLKKNILNHRIISQAKFLFENGIKERTQVLIDSNPSKNEELNRQLELLTNDKFMGKLFKVLEIDI